MAIIYQLTVETNVSNDLRGTIQSGGALLGTHAKEYIFHANGEPLTRDMVATLINRLVQRSMFPPTTDPIEIISDG